VLIYLPMSTTTTPITSNNNNRWMLPTTYTCPHTPASQDIVDANEGDHINLKMRCGQFHLTTLHLTPPFRFTIATRYGSLSLFMGPGSSFAYRQFTCAPEPATEQVVPEGQVIPGEKPTPGGPATPEVPGGQVTPGEQPTPEGQAKPEVPGGQVTPGEQPTPEEPVIPGGEAIPEDEGGAIIPEEEEITPEGEAVIPEDQVTPDDKAVAEDDDAGTIINGASHDLQDIDINPEDTGSTESGTATVSSNTFQPLSTIAYQAA
jgi:hypothetical protein